MQDVAKWLTNHHCDGVNLGIRELLYYQGKTSLLNLAPSRMAQATLAGAYLAKTKGRGMEFDEARHYLPGDDIRAIDWRVTARTGKTHTKLYREEKERPVFVLADLSASMQFGTQLLFKSVQVAHLTALIAWAARKRGDRIGGLIFNHHQHLECKPFTRQKAVLSLINGLVKLQNPNTEQAENGAVQVTLSDACARLRRLAHPGSLIFLLSDFTQLDDAAKQHITRLSRHCEVIAYPVSDPFEHELPQVNVAQRVALTDGYSQQNIMLGEKDLADRYLQQHMQHFNQVENSLKQCHAQVFNVTAALPLEQQFGNFIKGVRK